MSDLEGGVARFLTPMIVSGEPTVLDFERQLRIAQWATKTAMVFEYVNPGGSPYYTDEQRRALKDDVIPPEGVIRAWVGRYVGEPIGCQHLSLTLGAPSAFAHSSTFCVGEFVVQILAHSLRELRIRNNQVRLAIGPWSASLIEIWPPSDAEVLWPAVGMDFDTLCLLAYRFAAGARLHNGPDGGDGPLNA